MIGKKLFDYSVYHKYFSPEAMWNKISAVARKAGMELIYAVLLLYYVAIDPNTPKADKFRIYCVIGYFILPVDLIPDALPVIGWTDDMAAVVWVLKTVWNNITPEIRAKARRQLARWFGEVDQTELNSLLVRQLEESSDD